MTHCTCPTYCPKKCNRNQEDRKSPNYYTVRSDKSVRFQTSIVNDLFNIFPKFKKYVKAADDTFSYLVCFLKSVN